MRISLALVLTVVLFAMNSAPTSAAVVRALQGALEIHDPEGDRNNIYVRPVGLQYEVYDLDDDLEAGEGCESRSPHLAVCSDLVLSVRVDAGHGDDLVGLWAVRVPSYVDGGTGDDGVGSGGAPSGTDQIDGGDGQDSLYGGDGDDRIVGAAGDDFIEGQAGADSLLGGTGDDSVSGGPSGGDIVLGEDGQDLIAGGDGDDHIDGGSGDDALIGGRGHDDIATGQGVDVVFAASHEDAVDCRPGDRVQGARPAQCLPLDPSIERPLVWPPQEDVRSLSSDGHILLDAKIVVPKKARRFWVWYGLPPGQDDVAHVRVELKRAGGTRAVVCLSDVRDGKKYNRKVPKKARGARTAVPHFVDDCV